MSIHNLRRTLIYNLSLKHEPSNLTNLYNFSHFSLFSSSISTLITPTEKLYSEITNYLITHHNFSEESASKTSTFLTRLKDYKSSYIVLDFFKKSGISSTQLEELVLCSPRVLAADVNRRIKVRVERIRELGFSDIDLAEFLCNVPAIITLPRSVNAIVSSISILQSVLCSNSDVIKLLKTCNWFLSNDLDKLLVPNIELMKNCGISEIQIRRTLFNFPRFYLVKPELMRDCIRRVDELGLGKNSKMYIHGVRVVCSMSQEKWESKLNVFRRLGFSEDDILLVFRKTPQTFALSEKKILEVSKLLLSTERVDLTYLIQHAELLIYSAASRIEPRLAIINELVSKNLLKKEPTMTFACKMADKYFIRRFVLPYASEIGEVGAKYLATTGFTAI
ncbi:uncharacterized protein LOC104892587 [Beta vulgaris subsp. vulgaris]|uniref:uncharacterized protein LOC104892587 n=1 Tax=Beta vulgaris subsp. vulgaris TaxID=3555 RepID=UPI0020369D3B|nr:uncharacterized protein LOC104892587 [Beta vulgaris subsp. vulgaris]XP_048498389.1 uncharacterized protein LOC104892587 [Beta vulgaris subsp. vulgaris]XP_048498391.1 uncharacterized protein LOC104892587 [Beta vulgaris subsp. vulgaris]XP_048498397.1 uncharacterized protein LOC104892587 [Beta vulgaris subsp. vulgaris]XP_048498401.1 uncharacterized protein LOC104892587 [Beta vulgaris subsp. vulgaris]